MRLHHPVETTSLLFILLPQPHQQALPFNEPPLRLLCRRMESLPMDPHHNTSSGLSTLPPDSRDGSTVKMKPYNKYESLAMLQQPLSAAPREHDDNVGTSESAADYTAPTPVSLNLHFRRMRLIIVTTFMVTAIVAMAVFFLVGVELTTFDRTDMNSAEKDKLVSDYNSYTGYATTALGKPIDLFVTTTISVIALQLMAPLILRPEPNWKAAFVTLLATMGVGYLVANGFNAINVQARDKEIIPVITASDLTANDFVNASYINMTSSLNVSIPETLPLNPTTNTVLRNLILPRVFKAPLKCTVSSNSTLILQDDAVLFGMSQRDWMKAMLTTAISETNTLQVMINPTDASANANVKPDDMPMNASRAAFLVLNTLFLSSQFVPWGQNASWDDDDDILAKYQTDATNPLINVSTAIIAGLLPTDPLADEETQRRWLLNTTGPVLTDRFQETTATVLTNIPMNMTRVTLSHKIMLDALSFEIDVDPAKLTSVTIANKTRYLNVRSTQCGPFPGHCLIGKRDQPPSKPVMPAELLYDAPSQIHAFAICKDENGTEALQSTVRFGGKLDDLNVKSCPSTSRNSMLLVSVAKRLVADALLQSTSASATGLSRNVNSSVVVNLRKIYTFTVARLGWDVRNLATEFGAQCGDPSDAACMGLTYDLDADDTGVEQKLVVGARSLPVMFLTTPVYSAWASIARQRPVTLVQVNEPYKAPSTTTLADEAGDFLLPHNIKQLNWTDSTTRLQGDKCSMYTEDRMQLVLSNHLYMEQSLQATYTAGMFFLFQKATVRDVVNDTTSAMGNFTTLKFDQNVHMMSVWLSMPTQNAILTLCGCVLVVIGVVTALLWPRLAPAKQNASDPFRDITTAHVIAQVMLNEATFPPMLVDRRVVHATGVDNETKSSEEDAGNFLIGSVALHPQEDRATRSSMA